MIRCPQCGLSHNDEVLTCDCGYNLESLKKEITKQKHKNQDYPFLSKCRDIFKVVSVIYLLLFIAYFIISLVNAGFSTLITNLVSYIVMIISTVLLYGLAEAINLLLLKSKEVDSLKKRVRVTEDRVREIEKRLSIH